MLNKLKQNRKELMVLAILLLISGVAHGYNMFHFPYYENDEGTYISQAWSLLTQGKLAPYTYFYDHAPVGWFLIALWAKLTGGFFTFGFSINSGRVLMLVLHLLSTALLFGVAKKLFKSNLTATLASLIFTLSPLGIYFQRRVLLDNIMVFGLLLALFLILGKERKLHHFIGSAVIFGIAILTKESAIFFLPAFLYIVYTQSHKYHRSFAIVNWLSVSLGLISLYVLYALFKGEFFPSGSLLGGNQPHVSLIETLSWQTSRGGGSIFDPQSEFRLNLNRWLTTDFLIITLGAFASVINAILAIKYLSLRYIAILTLSYWLFLIRGGIVIELYAIPLIPLLALSIALTVGQVAKFINRLPAGQFFKYTPFLVSLIGFGFYYSDKLDIYTKNQTSAQVNAVKWVGQNIPKDSIILIDNYTYVDLHTKIPGSIYIQKDAHFYWKADKDPEIKTKILKNDWRTIDYILSTPQMKFDAYHTELDLVREAFDNSTLLVSFPGYGWDVEIYKVEGVENMLKVAWEGYKKQFVQSDGRVIDPYSENRSTSEGQAYTLLRAVWLNDQTTFDLVLDWTVKNLRLKENSLFAWWWGQKEDDSWGIKDEGTATDADEDIALALLFAYKQWGNQSYLEQARGVIKDIWEEETIEVQGRRYLTAGNWAVENKEIIVFNPSYFAPYAYRIFAGVDPEHDWMEIVKTSYEVLFYCSSNSLGLSSTANLPPNWCAMTKKGKILPADTISDNSSDYSYDAIRVMWRIALDYAWNQAPEAKSYLESIELWQKEWKEYQKIHAGYTHDGLAVDKQESLAGYGTQLGYFSVVDKDIADKVYEKKIAPNFRQDAQSGYWGNQQNYYDQNWVWFGTALYSDNLPNLWHR